MANPTLEDLLTTLVNAANTTNQALTTLVQTANTTAQELVLIANTLNQILVGQSGSGSNNEINEVVFFDNFDASTVSPWVANSNVSTIAISNVVNLQGFFDYSAIGICANATWDMPSAFDSGDAIKAYIEESPTANGPWNVCFWGGVSLNCTTAGHTFFVRTKKDTDFLPYLRCRLDMQPNHFTFQYGVPYTNNINISGTLTVKMFTKAS